MRNLSIYGIAYIALVSFYTIESLCFISQNPKIFGTIPWIFGKVIPTIQKPMTVAKRPIGSGVRAIRITTIIITLDHIIVHATCIAHKFPLDKSMCLMQGVNYRHKPVPCLTDSGVYCSGQLAKFQPKPHEAPVPGIFVKESDPVPGLGKRREGVIEKKSVLISMADRFGMEPSNFERTLRATVVPKDCGPEQFAAFLLVANQYNLNPITKEIYAFPTRGGGIQPIVGIDGWMKLMNSDPAMDGIEFVDHLDADGNIRAIECHIFRKDRAHFTSVIEYMGECKRDTEPWKKWPARMLRHKAAIQAARYAFGYSGIMEPDEYERGFGEPQKSAYRARKDGDWQVLQTEMNEIKTVEELAVWKLNNEEKIHALPLSWQEHFVSEFDRRMSDFARQNAAKLETIKKRGRPPKIKEQLKASLEVEEATVIEPTTGEIIDDAIPSGIEDPDKYLDNLESQLSVAKTVDEISDIWEEYKLVLPNMFPPDRDKAAKLFDKHQERVEGGK